MSCHIKRTDVAYVLEPDTTGNRIARRFSARRLIEQSRQLKASTMIAASQFRHIWGVDVMQLPFARDAERMNFMPPSTAFNAQSLTSRRSRFKLK
jgi:hypothetical protein